MMPLDGPEVCRRARAYRPGVPMYLILVTSREARDVVAGSTPAPTITSSSRPIPRSFDPG
jgi:hypothetical protein